MSNHQERNLLHTISGVLHSQSVRLAGHQNGYGSSGGLMAAAAMNPARRSMLVAAAANQQHLMQQQQQMPQQQGTQTLGRVGGQRLLGGGVPLVERLRQQQQQQNGGTVIPNGIPLQQMPSSAASAAATAGATLRKLPEGSILSRLAQEQQQQQQQQQPLQAVTMDGKQFLCLNLQQQQQQMVNNQVTINKLLKFSAINNIFVYLNQPTYITGTCSDTYVPFLPSSSAASVSTAIVNNNVGMGAGGPVTPGQIQAAVHSQAVRNNV